MIVKTAEQEALGDFETFCRMIEDPLPPYHTNDFLMKRTKETIRKALADKQWRDISTCPDDGTIVLLAWKNNIKPLVYNNAHMPDWEMEVRAYCINGTHGAKSYHGQATHWMPLPDAPPSGGEV